MVRAAATGAFDYTGSDPTNKHWRIKHRLIISELLAQQDLKFYEAIQQNAVGYVAHGNLTEESFQNVKTRATDTLKKIQKTLFPWVVEEESENTTEQNDTISAEDAALLARYQRLKEAAAGQQKTGQ